MTSATGRPSAERFTTRTPVSKPATATSSEVVLPGSASQREEVAMLLTLKPPSGFVPLR
ncbi:hypothetical protein ACFQ0M_42995 [Kitasatospora aburaviensis]